MVLLPRRCCAILPLSFLRLREVVPTSEGVHYTRESFGTDWIVIIMSLTEVRKVYARKITSVVGAYPGGMADWGKYNRQTTQWCELRGERYKQLFLGGVA